MFLLIWPTLTLPDVLTAGLKGVNSSHTAQEAALPSQMGTASCLRCARQAAGNFCPVWVIWRRWRSLPRLLTNIPKSHSSLTLFPCLWDKHPEGTPSNQGQQMEFDLRTAIESMLKSTGARLGQVCHAGHACLSCTAHGSLCMWSTIRARTSSPATCFEGLCLSYNLLNITTWHQDAQVIMMLQLALAIVETFLST